MTTQTQDSDVLLTMTDVSKSFPGVKALDHANLTVRSHSVHALMGENGAGKSTLLKCLFGIYAKDEGEILFLGKPVDFKTSKEALENEVKYSDSVDTNFEATPIYESMPYTISGEQWIGIRTEDMLLSRQLVNKNIRFDLDKIGTKNVTEKG